MNNSRTPGSLLTDVAKEMLALTNILKSGTALFVAWIIIVVGSLPVSFAQNPEKPEPSAAKSGPDLSQPLTIGWRYDSNLTLNLTPAFDDQRLYLPLAGGTIVSLTGESGQLNWRSEMGGELSASPVADSRAVYVASETGKLESGTRRATGALRALGREGGVTQWMRTLAMPLRGALTLGNGKLIAGGSDGKIYAFDSKNGKALWSFDYVAPFNSQPVVSGTRVYVGSEDGNLLALDEETGKLLWRYRTKGAVRGPVANGNEIVYFGSGDGYVYAVNVNNGRLLWRKRTGAAVQAVVRTGDELLVASLDNFVYKFTLRGARSWKRRLPGRISSQPLVAHGAALFMPLSGSAGVVLELRDGRQVNLLPTGEEIATSASPVAVGEVVLLTTEHGLIAFTEPSRKAATQTHKLQP
ncbi:MAG TPA: PQQ-binding-like beta-propeller repeat protein [Pyrinomonadaceae bacterium]|nr:PQQ-binding-like beta-propeller repeat protein [Pyrinomonadaceae bacterium]